MAEGCDLKGAGRGAGWPGSRGDVKELAHRRKAIFPQPGPKRDGLAGGQRQSGSKPEGFNYS